MMAKEEVEKIADILPESSNNCAVAFEKLALKMSTNTKVLELSKSHSRRH